VLGWASRIFPQHVKPSETGNLMAFGVLTLLSNRAAAAMIYG
jgi:hypothetical protein